MNVEGVAGRPHKKDAPRPHWYLLVLAVEPSLQGKGIGSSLLRPFLAECDKKRESVYLVTQNDANVAFYRKFGCRGD